MQTEDNVAKEIVEKFEMDRLREELLELDQKQQKIIYLVFYEKHSLVEAANILEMTYGTTRHLLKKTLADLKKKLSDLDGWSGLY